MKFEEMNLLMILALLPLASGDCPRHCYCSRYKTRCFLAKLSGLPPDIDPTTEQLLIERDHIAELTKPISDLPALSEIQLLYTNTSIIAQTAFNGMKQLTTIVISHNSIKEIDPETFVELHKLSKIDLSHNLIEIVHGLTFKGLKSLRYLDLSHNNINKLPIDLFAGISSTCTIANGKLNLSHNKIMHVDHRTFQNLCVFTELDISQNNLTVVSEGAFQGLGRLRALSLMKSNIKKISADSFSGLDHLDSLNLDGNLFTIFGEPQGGTVMNVKYLYLSSGNLKIIQEHSFENFTSLKELKLDNNKISNMSCDAFSKLESLLMLDLSVNTLTKLSSCMFQGLKSVTSLSLNHNQISALNNNTFKHLENLQILDLSFNNLTMLTDNTFSGLKHLRSLYLLNSQIQKIQPNSFLSLTSLSTLILSQNQLMKLQVSTFRNLESLNYLDMTQNTNLTIEPGAFRNLYRMHSLGVEVTSDNGKFLYDLIKNATSINHLKLSGIKTSLEFYEFEGIHIETLDISGNYIILLKQENFKELTMLKSLYIHSSSVQKISTTAFSKLKCLVELKLSDNLVEHLNQGIFAGLKSLEKLELDNNRIKSLDKGVFGSMCVDKDSLYKCSNTRFESQDTPSCIAASTLVQLRHLFLQNNNISYIHLYAFIHNTKLQTLDLSNNPIAILHFLLIPSLEKLILTSCNISTIPPQNFSCISNLRELHLNGNNIETLEVEALKPLNHLQYIDISNNPFICDCRFEETILWIKKFHHGESIQCVNTSEPWHYLLLDDYCYPVSTKSSDGVKFSVEDIVKQFEPVILFIIFMIGITGNTFILFLFVKHSELRTIHNAHLLNLAICDFMFLIMNIPLSYWNSYNRNWELGLTVCKVFMSLRDLSTAAAIYALIHTSFQRYNAIIPSSGMGRLISDNKLMWLCILIVWGIGLGAAIPVFLTATVQNKCLYSQPRDGFIEQTWKIHLVTFCIIPLLVIAVLNTRVSFHLIRSSQDCDDEVQAKTRVRISNVLWVQTTVFCISYLPNFLLRALFAWSVIESEPVSETVFTLCFLSFCLLFVSSCFNPIALIWMSIRFREIFFSHFECCRRNNLYFVVSSKGIPVWQRLSQFARTWRLRLRRSSTVDIQLNSSSVF